MLANLKDDREQSDYEIFSQIDSVTARRAIQEARSFVRQMDRFVKKTLQQQ